MEQSDLVVFRLGLGLLLDGAEILVRGAIRLAEAPRIAPLVIGLTVVAFGTSSPELAAAVVSARAGAADLALGNVVGSNLFNILVVLGLAAFVSPLIVQRKLIRLDVPIMIGVTAVLPLLAIDGGVGRTEGLLLSCGLLVYLLFLFWKARREDPGELQSVPGGILTAASGRSLRARRAGNADPGCEVAGRGRHLDRSRSRGQRVRDCLTLVGAGTSLPELATSFVASLRGQRDIRRGKRRRQQPL